MPMPEIRRQVAVALEAVNSKKAEDVTLLQLPRESSTFTDYFLICSGHNPRQVQAIADEVDEQLSKGMGVEPNNREGYEAAEWILLDYVDFVVHIFNAQRRAYYDLERLWKSAHKLTSQDLVSPQKLPQAQRAGGVPGKPAVGLVGRSSRAGRPAAAEAPATRKPPAKPAAKKKFPGVRAAAKQSARGAANAPPVKRSGASKGGKKVAAKKSSAGKAGAKKKSR